ncbi:MAG TPA: acyl carrier protein [Acidobacteriota bacterium]|nr:acyl carrier protein [Acidobacteriota bacterium]
MSDTIAQTVISIIAKTKRISPESITLDSTLDELKIDSLDGLNLFFELEEALDITIPDERAKTMRSVGQIVGELEKLLSGKGAKDSDTAVQT